MSISERAPPVGFEEAEPREAREIMWSKAVIAVRVGITIAWTGLLGFGLIKLIAYAM